MKQTTLHVFALTIMLLLAQGCITFPDGNSSHQEMPYSGVSFIAVEVIDNEPTPQKTFGPKVLEALKKLTYRDRPIELADSESAAVIIHARVSTNVLERIETPGLNQGRYKTTLSATFTSNYKNEVFFQHNITNSNIYSATPYGAAKKGAEWAADYLVKYYINEQFYQHIPISKFPKKESEEPAEPEPES